MPTLGYEWQDFGSYRLRHGSGDITFTVSAILIEQDVVNNRSKVRREWWYVVNDGGWMASDNTQHYLTGNGWTSSAYWNSGTSSSYVVLLDRTDWISHNDDGTGSFSCWGATWLGGLGVETGWVGQDGITLPTIARASKPTASPNPCVLWQGGQTLTVNTNRKSSAFKHTIRVQCGSWSWTSTARSVDTSVSVPIPYTVGAQIPSTSKTATATVTCTTYNGTTQIGSAQTCSVTIQINATQDHANIGTITVQDINSRTSSIVGAETFIYGISTLQATIPLTVSGDYTELASAVVTCGTRSQTYSLSGTSQTITFTFDRVDYNSLTVKVTDKRGNSVSKTKTYTLMAYQPETVTGTVGRVTATGSTAVGQVSGIAYGGNYGQASNSLTVTYKYKEHDSSTWTDSAYTATLTLNEGQQTYTHAITLLEAFDYQKQYDIQFIVNDLFNTATYTAQLMQGLPILSWDETEVDVWGDFHIHNREKPEIYQNVMEGFDMVFQYHANKNLLMITASTSTVNGITFTVNSDGTITANGTASGYASFTIGTFRATENISYVCNGCPTNPSKAFYIELMPPQGGADVPSYVAFDEYRWTEQFGWDYEVSICIKSGQTVSNLVFKPMIWDARIASDTFVPFAIRSAKVTITGKSTSADIYKFGKVVFFASPSDGTYSSGLNNIGTIPTGYRPATEVRIPIGNDARNTRFIIVQTTGAIQHYANNSASSNSNYGFTACWITYE
jgi:hypothetical protein